MRDIFVERKGDKHVEIVLGFSDTKKDRKRKQRCSSLKLSIILPGIGFKGMGKCWKSKSTLSSVYS